MKETDKLVARIMAVDVNPAMLKIWLVVTWGALLLALLFLGAAVAVIIPGAVELNMLMLCFGFMWLLAAIMVAGLRRRAKEYLVLKEILSKTQNQ